MNGLKKVKLVDAAWIWTEPHSRRLKLKLTVQKEVGNGAVLQQAMAVTFVVRNQQCEGCAAAFTNNTWTAVVQVRQRVDHKRTFFYLEQLILKHSAHSQCTNIQVGNGRTAYMRHRLVAGGRCLNRLHVLAFATQIWFTSSSGCRVAQAVASTTRKFPRQEVRGRSGLTLVKQ